MNIAPKQEFDRAWNGRPKIILPDGSEDTYTRCTTFIDVLEDKYHLRQYDMRMVAAGLGQRPDLHLRAASLGLEPLDAAQKKHWKKDMDEVTKAAKEAGQASAKATVGSSLHTYTERMDRGETLGHVPDFYRKHLATWQQVTAGIEWRYVEQPTVNDELRVAGTPDRIGVLDGSDRLVIADTKSGNTQFGLLKMAMQLAIYARSQLYNVLTGERTPLDNVDLDRGLILPLSAETGDCEPFWVNLDLGWKAVQCALQVRSWRSIDNRRQLTEPYQPPPPQLTLVPDQPTTDVGAALVHAIRAASTPDELVHLWHLAHQRGRDEWTEAHTQLAAARKAELLKGTPAA